MELLTEAQKWGPEQNRVESWPLRISSNVAGKSSALRISQSRHLIEGFSSHVVLSAKNGNVGIICGICVPKNVSTSQKSYEIFHLAIPIFTAAATQQRAEWQVSSERLEHPKSVNLTILPALVSQFSSQSWWIVELVRPVPKFLIVAN